MSFQIPLQISQYVCLLVAIIAKWFKPLWTLVPVSNLAAISVVSCGDPGTPQNGVRYGDTFTYESTVVLECHPGYKLVGDLTRKCQADGTWSGIEPTCQRKYWIYGRAVLSNLEEEFTAGMSVIYSTRPKVQFMMNKPIKYRPISIHYRDKFSPFAKVHRRQKFKQSIHVSKLGPMGSPIIQPTRQTGFELRNPTIRDCLIRARFPVFHFGSIWFLNR